MINFNEHHLNYLLSQEQWAEARAYCLDHKDRIEPIVDILLKVISAEEDLKKGPEENETIH